MYNEKIKIIDNNLNGENEYSCSQNLKYKRILIYLELISVNQLMKQNSSCQCNVNIFVSQFWDFIPFLRTFYSNVHNTPFNDDLKTDMPLFTETLSLQ